MTADLDGCAGSLGSNLDDGEAPAAALASLGISPGRLRRILQGRSPRRAWQELVTGTHPEDPDGRLRAATRPGLPGEILGRCRSAGVSIAALGGSWYPASLAGDPEAPAVLFASGHLEVLDRWPRVAVVGTRSASAVGREVARDIGRSLAESGVVVVSGLAPGIDTAALTGATDVAGEPAVAVLGTAHDGLSSPEQVRLASGLAERGCVISELPPGTESARWRFAVRNRVMAALAQLVVVVECHLQGGALHTVRAARRRSVPVAAVPGSLRSSSSAGTNELLVAGAACVRQGDDVLSLLARVSGWSLHRPAPGPHEGGRRPGPSLDPVCQKVFDALDDDAVSIDAVALRSGESLSSVALALERLAQAGSACAEAGFWRRRGTNGAGSLER